MQESGCWRALHVEEVSLTKVQHSREGLEVGKSRKLKPQEWGGVREIQRLKVIHLSKSLQEIMQVGSLFPALSHSTYSMAQRGGREWGKAKKKVQFESAYPMY